MTKNILITREIPNIAISMLESKGYVVDINKEDKIFTQEELLALLSAKPYDGVITLLTDKIDEVVFKSSPSIKIISNYASGYDNVDIDQAKAHGVVVANSPTPLTNEAVAQHTIAFMLTLANRIIESDKFIREGKYDGWSPMRFIGTALSGKTLGLVGGGKIGERVACFAKGLGLKIIYTDVNKNEKMEQDHGAVFYSSLEELLPQVDFLSLHVPLLPSTKHLINEKTLRMMKPTSFLINSSRGPVVDEHSLVKALQDKVIAGAGLDVFEFEPQISPELIQLPNVVLTPHTASANLETREDMAKVAAQNLIDFFKGEELKNIVNK